MLKEEIKKLSDNAIDERVFPGCVVGVVTKQGKKIVYPFGHFTYDEGAKAVDEETIYDVASVTKVIPTSALAFAFIDQGKISHSTKLIEFVPEYVGSYRKDITLFHLLTQSLAFPYSLSSFAEEMPQQILEKIFHSDLFTSPGTSYQYTNTTSILLGLLLERVGGKKLDALANEYFFGPLGMEKTTYDPKGFSQEDIVPSEIVAGKEIRSIVHDESARALLPLMHVGSAGIFSTAGDLLLFFQMLLGNGNSENKQFFRLKTIEQMYTPVGLKSGENVGLGWEVNAHWMGKTNSQKAIGKTGFTGCFVFCDFEKGIGIVHLSNRILPHRPESGGEVNNFRKALIDCVISAAS